MMTTKGSIKFFLTLTTLLALNTSSHAANERLSLTQERARVVKQYINDLKNADYRDIITLFEKDGIVISTVRGKINAKDFFYSFLPEIKSANATLTKYFISPDENNIVAARFHFDFLLKDGKKGEGDYIDEFIFTHHSEKLKAVYMYENLKVTNAD